MTAWVIGTIGVLCGPVSNAVYAGPITERLDGSGVEVKLTPNAFRSELKRKGYSEEAIDKIIQFVNDGEKFKQEYKLEEWFSNVRFAPISNNIKDRLNAASTNLWNLESLGKQLSLTEAMGAEKITPQNVLQVFSTIHTIIPEELRAIKPNQAEEEWERERITRQGKRWETKAIPAMTQDQIQHACNTANELLSGVSFIRRETVRRIVTEAFTWYGPKPTNEIEIQNRPLNIAQWLSAVSALTKPDKKYAVTSMEMLKIEIGGSTYSLIPEWKVSHFPWLPAEYKGMTVQAYNIIQSRQELGMKSVQNKITIAKGKDEIAKMLNGVSELQQELKLKEQKAQLDNTVLDTANKYREELLKLMNQYIASKDNPQEQAIIRSKVQVLAEKIVAFEAKYQLNKQGAVTNLNNVFRIITNTFGIKVNRTVG